MLHIFYTFPPSHMWVAKYLFNHFFVLFVLGDHLTQMRILAGIENMQKNPATLIVFVKFLLGNGEENPFLRCLYERFLCNIQKFSNTFFNLINKSLDWKFIDLFSGRKALGGNRNSKAHCRQNWCRCNVWYNRQCRGIWIQIPGRRIRGQFGPYCYNRVSRISNLNQWERNTTVWNDIWVCDSG